MVFTYKFHKKCYHVIDYFSSNYRLFLFDFACQEFTSFFLFAFLHFSIFLIWSLHSWFLFHPHNFIGYMLRSPFLGQSVGKRLSIGPKGFSTCKNALLSSITFHQIFIYLILWRFSHMNFS